MTTIELAVRMTRASSPVMIKVDAFEAAPGLAVHKKFMAMEGHSAILAKKGWQITHVLSGMGINNPRQNYPTKVKAVEVAKALSQIINWNREGDEILESVDREMYRTKIAPLLNY